MKRGEQIEQVLHNLASPKRGHTFWGMVVWLIVASILLWAKHSAWLSNPNDIMFAKSPDSFKNYLTSAWHVQHGSSYVHFGGMNHPFGEHILFSPNQPIVSVAMQWWSRNVDDLSGHEIGIIHLLLVISIVFGVLIIYLLLRKLHLPVWYAGLAALGIALLSPQYNYFEGQFGLSHIWVLPMLLLLLCRYEERQSRRYQSLLIGILIWFAAQFHFYYLGISAIFLGFYTLFQIMLRFSWRNIWTRLSHLTVMVLLPYAALNIWVHWSDYCSDRPVAPIGFSDHLGRWEGVFLPYHYFPVQEWIHKYFNQVNELELEAQSYIGLVATVFTLWLLFKRRFRLFEPEWDQAAYHRVHKNYLRGICFSAFAILLFSLGIPFSINGLSWMADYLGPIRQFRGLGRFAWGFYYPINILIFYILWNKNRRLEISEKWMAIVKRLSTTLAKYFPGAVKWGLVLMPLLVLCAEAYYFQKPKTLQLMPNLTQRSVLASSPDHWLNKVDFGRIQALMPLPYYHVGSENLWLEAYYPLFQKVQYTALQTGVPDMGVNMSRSAVGRMVKSVQFALTACEAPAILSELPDNRPIALMIEPSYWEEVQIKYKHLVSKANLIYQGPELRIMTIVPDSVRSWSQQETINVSSEMNRIATIDVGGGWHSASSPMWYSSINFDSIVTSQHIFQGNGAGEGKTGDTTWIWQKPIPKGKYVFSIWIKADEDMGLRQELKIVENSQLENYFEARKIPLEIKTIVKGWALLEGIIDVEKKNSTVGVFIRHEQGNATFWYDEVLIRDARFNLYRREPPWVVQNNYWYKLANNGSNKN
ncbi:MAG: hypothetical protein ACKVT2_15295 [Saprospiraceae bacterium]